MELKTIMQADYLDILYDNRNKKYGGYELRKHYDQRISKALLTLVFITALACFYTFSRHKNDITSIAHTAVISPVLVDITHPKQLEKIDPPKAEHVAMEKVKTKLFTDPVITNDLVPDDRKMSANKDLRNVTVGEQANDGDSTSMSPGSDKVGSSVTLTSAKTNNEPLRWVEQMPLFSGDMNVYLASSLHYPDVARESNIEGVVIVEFIVNEDGAVSNAVVRRGIGGGCDQEALRVVNNMPRWKPGKQNGKAVKVFFALPIRFVLR